MRIHLKHITITALALGLTLPAHAGEGKILFSSERNGNSDIFVMDPYGTVPSNLTNTPSANELTPTWKPDASRIIYRRGAEIWTMGRDGSTQTAVPNVGGTPQYPFFKPDSDLISYSRQEGRDWDLFTNNVTGTSETRLTSNYYGDYHGSWRPDGSKLAFFGFEGAGPTPYIYLANPDGTGQTRLTSGGDRNPSWSTDGTRILFNSQRHGKQQIYVINADGTGETRLTSNAYNDEYAVFSPDGNKIAFASDRSGNWEIYTMNADGTGQTRITNNPGIDYAPAWHPYAPEGAPTASISDAVITEGNSGSVTANFTVTLSAPQSSQVTLNYQTVDATAKAGVDYTAIPSTPLVFAPGQTSKTISVTVNPDTLYELDETFSVNLTSPTFYFDDSFGLAIIKNDDALPTLGIDELSVNEGNSGANFANFKITLTPASGIATSVNYETLDGTALSTGGYVVDKDYTPVKGTLTIPAGATSATVSVKIWTDTFLESNDIFYLKLSNPVNARLGRVQNRCTIVNDDTKPLVMIYPQKTEEGSTLNVDVVLSRHYGKAVSFSYFTNDYPLTQTILAPAVAGQDYVATSGTIDFPAGTTRVSIPISTLDDKRIEKAEFFVFGIKPIGNDLVYSDPFPMQIVDNDLAKVSISDVTLAEGDSGTPGMYFTATLSAAAPYTTSVAYTTADGTATAGTDYTYRSGTLTFNAGQTSVVFFVPITGDTSSETDETFVINLSAPNQLTLFTSQATGTIVNDDAPSGGLRTPSKPSLNLASTMLSNPVQLTSNQG